jgi:hypothetical protein
MKSKKQTCLLLFNAATILTGNFYISGVPCCAQQTRLQRPAQNTDPVKLTGAASFDENIPPPDEKTLLGSWKAHVLVVERHPTVVITTCTESEVSGTYIGQFGRFPLTGTYDKESGKVNLSVDFTGLKLLKLRGLNSAKAVLVGTIHGTAIKGQATFPEFHDKTFQWEAVQISQETGQ